MKKQTFTQMSLLEPFCLVDGTPVNEHGVFQSGYETVRFQVPSKPWIETSIQLAQLNNGEWIHSNHHHTNMGGGGRGLWLNSTRYPSRKEALEASIDELLNHMDNRLKHADAAEKRYISTLKTWLLSQKEQPVGDEYDSDYAAGLFEAHEIIKEMAGSK